MRTWQLGVAVGAIAVVLLLTLGLERQRNCRYTGGIHCETFGVDPRFLFRSGSPQHR